MKKIGLLFLIVLCIAGLMVQGAQAGGYGRYGGGSGHGYYGGYGRYGGSGHGYYGGYGHGGYYRGGWRGGIYLGGPIVGGWPWYPYGYYPYSAPPAVVQQNPIYVEPQQEETYYWYYCQSPKGYYPYVKSCPSGWMKVVPETTPQAAPPN